MVREMNTIKVTENIFRGSHPTDRFAGLSRLGIRNTICLQSGVHDMLDGEAYTLWAQARTHGISVHYFPQSNFTAPNDEKVRAVLSAISYLTEGGQKVFIHCKHGKDRTGYMVAAFRMQAQGWSYEKSVNEMHEHGFHRVPYFFWVKNLRKYEKLDA
jgi:protein-tyrosine phosphatase